MRILKTLTPNKPIFLLWLIPFMLSAKVTFAQSGEAPVTIIRDSVPTDTTSHPGFITRMFNKLFPGNRDRTFEKPIDLSFAGAPFYSKEASVGIGAIATGLFRINRADSTMLPSEVTLSLTGSIKGMCILTGKGNILFPDHRSKLTFRLEAYRERLKFWGLTALETAANPEARYDRRQIDFQADYSYEILPHLLIGAAMRINYTDAINISRPEYLLGARPRYFVSGIGPLLEYDSRDNYLYPTEGIHLTYKPLFFPKQFGNAPDFFMSHQITFNTYTPLWRGGILASDLYGKFNSNKAPWTMYEMVTADAIRMRGYYMGSFMDRNQIAAQIELRQHIYGRFGAVAWAGVATLFSSFKDFNNRPAPQWLHNFGIGLRFEFKKNVNIRVDYGFGRHTSGIVFAVGEAF